MFDFHDEGFFWWFYVASEHGIGRMVGRTDRNLKRQLRVYHKHIGSVARNWWMCWLFLSLRGVNGRGRRAAPTPHPYPSELVPYDEQKNIVITGTETNYCCNLFLSLSVRLVTTNLRCRKRVTKQREANCTHRFWRQQNYMLHDYLIQFQSSFLFYAFRDSKTNVVFVLFCLRLRFVQSSRRKKNETFLSFISTFSCLYSCFLVLANIFILYESFYELSQ